MDARTKRQVKDELIVHCLSAIVDFNRTIRGAHLLGAGVRTHRVVGTNVIQVHVPSGPIFELTIKEAQS